MDALNQALYQLLVADAQLSAAAPGGVWNLRADEGTPLPLVKFQLVTPTYDYVFAGLSSERYVYRVTAHAESSPTFSGAQLAAVASAQLKRVLTDAILNLAGSGSTLLSCRPFAGVSPACLTGQAGRDEYSEGQLVEIVIAPTA